MQPTYLTGIACCPCGLLVHGGGASHKQPIYRCRSAAMLASERPAFEGTHVNRLTAPVDEFVYTLVIARLSRRDARDLLVDRNRPDTGALTREANALRATLRGMAAEFGSGLAAGSALPPRSTGRCVSRSWPDWRRSGR